MTDPDDAPDDGPEDDMSVKAPDADESPENAPDGDDGTPDDGPGPDYETGIHARESPYLDRYVQLGVASEKLINVSFPEDPNEGAEDDYPLLDRVFAYLEGKKDQFEEVDIALTVPTEQRTVLEALRNVPYGEDVSVERLARMAGLDDDDQDDLQTVRMALDTNPVPVVVPDHRVRDGPSSAPPKVEQKLRSLEGL
jgi:methylated-DNA-[protein]-cysteine S-methyltransferase